MKTLLPILAILSCCGLNIAAQTPTPSPVSADGDVVKISTNLVQIDVSVTDEKGTSIKDLKADEIEIFENGKKQKVNNFSFVSAGKAGPAAKGKPSPGDKSAITLPPVSIGPEAVRRTIALVVDDLSLSWISVYFTRRALRKFVDEQMQDGDLVAIVRTGGGIGSLQQFTTDKRVLYAAIEKVRYNPMGSGMSDSARIEASQADTLRLGLGDMNNESQAAEIDKFLAAGNDARAGIFASGTLGALQYLVSGMKQLPGRESAILFSDGFRIFNQNSEGSSWSGTTSQYIRRLIEEANRAAVVFYAIDPRGLQIGVLEAADNTRGMRQQDVTAAVNARRYNVWESQSSLLSLSRETGGFAVVNNNDLVGGMRKILEAQSYYLVGYVPDSDTFDATNKYNKLDVKVLRKGATVRYRNGFFGVTDTKRITAPPPSKTASYIAQLQQAIFSPFAVNGITLRLNSLFGVSGDNGPYVLSLLHIDAADLKFTDEQDGSKKCVFEALGVSFGAAGEVVDQMGKRFTMTVKPDDYEKIVRDGFVFQLQFPVKKPGAYQYRVAIRDALGGKVGAASQFIQVPDLKKDRLTLSGISLENMSVDEYQRSGSPEAGIKTDAVADTAFRKIKVGRIYRYSLAIYNAQLNSAKRPNLETHIRVFYEGKLILDGQSKAYDSTGQTDMEHLRFGGGLAIGSQMEPGDYVLQVIVTDNIGKEKRQVAWQIVQFEVVE